MVLNILEGPMLVNSQGSGGVGGFNISAETQGRRTEQAGQPGGGLNLPAGVTGGDGGEGGPDVGAGGGGALVSDGKSSYFGVLGGCAFIRGEPAEAVLLLMREVLAAAVQLIPNVT